VHPARLSAFAARPGSLFVIAYGISPVLRAPGILVLGGSGT
jgi:hypothetical protein